MTPSELRQLWLTARHQPAAQGHLARDLAAWPDAQVVTFPTEIEPEVDQKSSRSVHEVDASCTETEPGTSGDG
jgi:hypothetical protein